MQLQELIQAVKREKRGGLPEKLPASLKKLEVTKVTADSRQVIPGAMFIAVKGLTHDGHAFLQGAVEKEAGLLIGQIPDPELGVPYLEVRDSRVALGLLAAAWHGFPARQLVMIGVTGTDGKTTTSNLIYQILSGAGLKTGMITSVNAVIGERESATGLHVTTPDPLEIQGYLKEMVAAGLTHCVLETTSHGLHQKRVIGCDFDFGVITNVTHEHLDYHGSYDEYLHAKGLLFESLGEIPEKSLAPDRFAVLNIDDSSYPYLSSIATVPVVSYGLSDTADVVAKEISIAPEGLSFTAQHDDTQQIIRSELIGRYNVANILAAYTFAVKGLNLSPETVAREIGRMESVPGRMEWIDLGQEFLAVVDFAHTPNSLQKVLAAARKLSSGKVIALFGAAGLRDRAKRRMMAEISAESADYTILTAEDPRTESLDLILEEMAQGVRGLGGVEGTTFWRIPDRGEAMRFAVGLAKEGDIVLALGKGHEQSMAFGSVEYPWDDRIAMRAALAELLEMDGPKMPELPTSG